MRATYLSYLLPLCLSIFIVGCQSTKSVQEYKLEPSLLVDDLYPSHHLVKIPSEAEIFAVSASMHEYIQRDLMIIDDPLLRAEELATSIFTHSNQALLYDNSANYTAPQTFESHSANCLSLTILAYTLAREAGLMAVFQEVSIPEYWVRRQGQSLLNGHVNLAIAAEYKDRPAFARYMKLEIDFDQANIDKSFPRTLLTKSRIIAMFYNNLGADALLNKDFDAAYALFKQSVMEDPSFAVAWGNLGLTYRNSGQTELAQKTYRHALSLDEQNLTIWSNLAYSLGLSGNEYDAYLISVRIANRRVSNPFYHYMLGDESYARGDYQRALEHFHRAVKMNKNAHQFYFGLAKSYYQLGNIDRSEYYLNKAKRHAVFDDQEQTYASKLSALK